MDLGQLTRILEAALLAADDPLSLNQLEALFPEDAQPGHALLREALAALGEELAGRSVELTEVASGFRLQVRRAYQPWIARLWQQRPPRYSRALLETLVLIAYRQPVTRGEIEEIRGVAVSTHIIRTLEEREWVRVVGHRDVPGRPALFGTTRRFLDYFGLKSLDELPTLAELRDLDDIEPEFAFGEPGAPSPAGSTPGDRGAEASGAPPAAAGPDAQEADEADAGPPAVDPTTTRNDDGDAHDTTDEATANR